MNKKSYSRVFDAAARQHIPDHTDLAPRIMTRLQKGKGVSMRPAYKILAAALAAVLAVAVLLANGPAVVRAVQQIFGYIPGLGTVETGDSLRVLSEPAAVTQDGVTVTVEQGSIDSKYTILRLNLAGLPPREESDLCFVTDPPQLRLPEGAKFEMLTTGLAEAGMRLYFPALPAGSSEAVLEIPCLWSSPAPGDWEIPLRFVAATASNPFPVFDIPASAPGAQAAARSPYNIGLTLEQVVPLEDGYVWMGRLTWGSGAGPLSSLYDVYPHSIRVLDADGQPVEGEFYPPDDPDPAHQLSESAPWAFKVYGRQHAWPLTLTVESVVVERNGDGLPAFRIDLGSDPQIGQTIVIDQVIQGPQPFNHTFHVRSAELAVHPDSGEPGILFEVQTDPQVLGLTIEAAAGDGRLSTWSVDGPQPGMISVGSVFFDGIPGGEQTFTISGITVRVDGNWQVTWQP